MSTPRDIRHSWVTTLLLGTIDFKGDVADASSPHAERLRPGGGYGFR
jgi:hypothetical protein